ncbi:hypothetical protein SAMN05443247_04559 [Bradyrhizobium erythrophlei]|jgi:hypothetical protein|nr:hypothetical protein SAMN05443247_04559 [Bradyrhizobium erythrophlei]
MKILLPDDRDPVDAHARRLFLRAKRCGTGAPAFATIFKSFDAAEDELARARQLALVAPAQSVPMRAGCTGPQIAQ